MLGHKMGPNRAELVIMNQDGGSGLIWVYFPPLGNRNLTSHCFSEALEAV